MLIPERLSSWVISGAVINLPPSTLSTLLDKAFSNPLIFDWSMGVSDDISSFEMVPFSIFAEVIESSATEDVIPVNPEPSPENELAVIVPVDEIEPEVIVPVNIGDSRGALSLFSVVIALETSSKAEATLATADAKFPSAFCIACKMLSDSEI